MFSCESENILKDDDKYFELWSAILYKSSQCQTQPNYFLILPKKFSKRWYNACVFSIIRMDCPFSEYPIVCYKIYEKEE